MTKTASLPIKTTADGLPIVPDMQVWIVAAWREKAPYPRTVGTVYDKWFDYIASEQVPGEIGAKNTCAYGTLDNAKVAFDAAKVKFDQQAKEPQ